MGHLQIAAVEAGAVGFVWRGDELLVGGAKNQLRGILRRLLARDFPGGGIVVTDIHELWPRSAHVRVTSRLHAHRREHHVFADPNFPVMGVDDDHVRGYLAALGIEVA
jgi:hypothetical protein